MDPSLYGWRHYGDEGLISGASGYQPGLLRHEDDAILCAAGFRHSQGRQRLLLLSAYAALQTNGTLNVLVINKDPVASFNGQLNFTGFSPAGTAISHTYGEFQDNATSSNLSATLQDIAATNISSASNLFSYSFPPYSLTVLTFRTDEPSLPSRSRWQRDWIGIRPPTGATAIRLRFRRPCRDTPCMRCCRARGCGARRPNPRKFPGNVLTMEGDRNFVAGGSATIGEIRLEASPTTFPRLVMSGGQVDASIGDYFGLQYVINGEMDIDANTPFYDDSTNDAGFMINAFLTGAGQIEFHDLGYVIDNGNTMNITGNTNTYSGTWNVVQGTLLGTGPNALGTNSITVGADGALETAYNINNPKGTLTLNGRLLLHQNDTFQSVSVGGTAVFAGIYSFDYLSAQYPAYFPAAWPVQSGSSVSSGSGSLTVLAGPPPPTLAFQDFMASNLVLSWSNGGLGLLMAATNVAGPWSPVSGASSPLTNVIAPSAPQLFFRLRAQ